MVKFWEVLLDKSIKTTKRRIQFCEKHGIGDTAMKEKSILKKLERKKELLKDDTT